eukprot:Colp12_sorted_trinity150504_noHs@7336
MGKGCGCGSSKDVVAEDASPREASDKEDVENPMASMCASQNETVMDGSSAQNGDSTDSTLAALMHVPLFSSFPLNILAALAAQATVVHFASGTKVAVEGEGGEQVLVLRSGQCSVWRTVGSKVDKMESISTSALVGLE